MKMNVKDVRLLKYTRLILLIIVLIYYSAATTNLSQNFEKTILPFAKNYFHFVKPVSVTGDSDIFDFATFYASGLLNRERLLKHHDIDVYDPILLTQTIERLFAPMHPVEVYSIQYPPILFALTTPLAYFDLSTAWRIWLFASAICLAIAFLCVSYESLKQRKLFLIALPICFANVPAVLDVSLGQTTAFELAIIAVSLRLLMNKNYFWAGLIAGISFFKLQQALIILIPGMCVGKRKFFYGCILAVILEGLLSGYLVGYSNLLNFIKTNYLCEITHAYIGLNQTCFMSNFRSMLCSLPVNIPDVTAIAASIYILGCTVSGWLWLKLYPALQKVSNQAFELIASVSTIILVYFSMHGYLYDFLFLLIPTLWLYIWSTTDDSRYTVSQTTVRLLITLATFVLPFLFQTNLDLLLSENINVNYQLRCMCGIIAFLFCAIAAVIIEFKQGKLLALAAK